MKKTMSLLICAALICLTMNACFNNTKYNNLNINKKNITNAETSFPILNKNAAFELTIWNDNFDETYTTNAIKQLYPNATCKFVKKDKTDDILAALASSQVPDLIFSDINQMNELNCINGFDNFLDKNYDFNSIKQIFSETELKKAYSFEGKKLIAVPLTPSVVVTFYRADILEQCGITSDPEKLGELIKDPKGWLSVAEKLKENNKWALQWNNEFIEIYANNLRFFDEDMNLSLDKQKLSDILNTSNEANKLGLESHLNIWDSTGQQAIRNDNFAMLYLGDWAVPVINNWAPETAGKWRVTNLPFNINCVSNEYFMSIPSKSKYKPASWELIKALSKNNKDFMDSNLNTPDKFLGNQKPNLIYNKLRNELPISFFTPLDNTVFKVWKQGMYTALGSNDVNSVIDKTDKDISDTYSKERDYLKQLHTK